MNACALCHGIYGTLKIRNCEQCHGYESLHSIQADSNGDGEIVAGEEDNGFGHVGTGDFDPGSDCYGCHLVDPATASVETAEFGQIIPYMNGSSKAVILAGTNTSITLNGSSFTDPVGGTEFDAVFMLTSKEGDVVELTTQQINGVSSTVTIPGTTAPGNYLLTAVKYGGAAISNPLPISIIPPIIIESSTIRPSCGSCSGELTLTGAGFGDTPPPAAENYINVMQNNVPLNITTWSDTRITATGAVCDGSEITVNGLFGSATQ